MFQILLQSPPKKVTPLFPNNPPVKIKVLSRPLFEHLVGGSTPLPATPAPVEGGRVHTLKT